MPQAIATTNATPASMDRCPKIVVFLGAFRTILAAEPAYMSRLRFGPSSFQSIFVGFTGFSCKGERDKTRDRIEVKGLPQEGKGS